MDPGSKTPFVYLHGLTSSPGSTKAGVLRARLAACGYNLYAPDLNVPVFEKLTVTAQVKRVGEFLANLPESVPPVLIGSSLGALSTILHTVANPDSVDRVVLIAPALELNADRLAGHAGSSEAEWCRCGFIKVHHSMDNRIHKLGYQLIEDIAGRDFHGPDLQVPVLVIHGEQDEVVAFSSSQHWVSVQPLASLAPISGGDHQLLDSQDQIWNLICEFSGITTT